MHLPFCSRLFAICAAFLPISLAGSQAYVSLGGPGGSVSLFESSGRLLRTFAVPPGSLDIVVNLYGTRLYAGTTSEGFGDVKPGSPKLISVLDPATGRELRR